MAPLRPPRCAVCRNVLNLLSQVGAILDSFALPIGYRIPAREWRPYFQVLAQNDRCAITHTAGLAPFIPQNPRSRKQAQKAPPTPSLLGEGQGERLESCSWPGSVL